MRAFVCIKQVPDTDSRIRIKSDASRIETDGIKWIMNPFDEFAVEEALKLKEGGKCSRVTVISLGPKQRVNDALRSALAMGADDAICIDTVDNFDAFSTAKALSAAIKKEGDIYVVLAGKLSIDENNGAVPQMIAENLGIPHLSVVSKLEATGSGFTLERDTEGGTKEIFNLTQPAVISANKGLNTPRRASLPGIMNAKKKPLVEITPSSLGVEASQSKMNLQGFSLPPEKAPAKILSGELGAQVNELVRLLRAEAKVV